MSLLTRIAPFGMVLVLLLLAATFVVAEWRRLEIARLNAQLETLQRERDAAQAALAETLKQRDRAAATARSLENKQRAIREEAQRLRAQIREVAEAHMRCVAAVDAIRKELKP